MGGFLFLNSNNRTENLVDQPFTIYSIVWPLKLEFVVGSKPSYKIEYCLAFLFFVRIIHLSCNVMSYKPKP